jgi:hypothetical protein
VAEALQLLSLHLPKDQFPAFWFDDFTQPQTSEYRGIWCGFHSSPSMIHFPEIDPDKHFAPGTPLIVMDEHEDSPPAAAYRLARAGTPAAFLRSDRISRGTETYWMHYFEMLPATLASLRDGFTMTRQLPLTRPSAVGSGAGIYLVAGVDLHEPGIYQFELRHTDEASGLTFGSWTAAGWQNRSALPFHDGAASISWFRQVVTEPGRVEVAIQLDQDSAQSLAAMNTAAIVVLRQAPPATGMQTPYWPDALAR